ncbi:hypothetical protein J2I47_26325 [Fibrella sp. HMF5335]|uniref:Uncharacterized protein n=1 Tax=Fibrella rubiginis TaxID=2817060 RepID=A0A939K7L6_9BACT|nr:hypothetical protein [Fibrella rubiginis]MBO0940088.1 hypothetical protein [Fibrella rubiginis]
MEQLSEQELVINQALSKMPWCDCQIIPGNYGSLVLAVSEDLTYFHTIEVIFNNVSFSKINHWFSVDPKKGLFQLLSEDERTLLNREFRIEMDFRLFKLIDEENVNYYVAAKSVSVNYDSVLYYYKEDLTPSQRIASWITKPQ